QSPGALAVSLYFDQFNLPAGGELYAYNETKTQVIGAFTDFNNDPSGLFATEIIQGESVTIEYYQPETVASSPVISISDLAYIFRGVFFEMVQGNGRDQSQWCMININCEEGDDWQLEKKGIVRQYMYLPDGWIGWCSGTLINNTAWNLEPYVLSAHHCGEGCTSGQFNQWIFYFKYEAATCSGTSGPENFTMTGCHLKAEGDRYTGSDFALYLLNQDVPDTHEPYWNGWNRTNVPSPSGVGIHHPNGDIKKISTYTLPLQSQSWEGNGVLSHWYCAWSQTENGTSVIEGGSSGSPLFDNEHRIVGDLTGSWSSLSCDNPYLNQYSSFYGKVYWSWDKMGNDPSQQLKCWLDPQNTGQEYLPGTFGVAPTADFEASDPTITPGGSVNFFDLSLGKPVEWEWTFTGGEPPTSTDQDPQGIVFTEYGTHTVKLTASNPFGSDTETKTGYITVGDAPVADFYADQTEIVSGGAVYFYDASLKNPTSWSWQFEGGNPSTSFIQNPGPIYYSVPGVYKVKLTAINDFGADTETRPGYITVLGPPNADFSANQTMIPVGGSVNFTDLSTGNPTEWAWSFQGGTPSESTDQHPQGIVYNEAGEFNVTLSVTSDIGTDDTTMVGYIQVVSAPVPNFTSPERYLQAGTSTTFVDYTSGNPDSWLWEFEGGTPATSDAQDPGEIVYNTVGDFDVTLTATNEYGSQSVTKPNYIHVGDVPQADFMASGTFIAVGEGINFSDLSTNNPTSWSWVFEGGTPGTSSAKNPVNITYEQVGIYDVTLTVTNTYGQDTEVRDNFVEVGYVGIEDRKLTAENIDLYPNPTTGELVLDLKGDIRDVISIQCFNSVGERLLEITGGQGILHQMQIDLAGNPPGLYLLSVQIDDDVIIKRVTLVK
ncbi:MAG: PKD domain-containing protein, partial [Lentimicrobiaceae bacterium]|nr:PKD domain-containing protein [Lentimicrobiaceae bacterium]